MAAVSTEGHFGSRVWYHQYHQYQYQYHQYQHQYHQYQYQYQSPVSPVPPVPESGVTSPPISGFGTVHNLGPKSSTAKAAQYYLPIIVVCVKWPDLFLSHGTKKKPDFIHQSLPESKIYFGPALVVSD